ncbi:MAG: fused MFS/spermidine synthase [Thermoanaerobaculia bacterium]|nr:fused MFS/spermidine synthase [Thermoanaerobaculia bacterium]
MHDRWPRSKVALLGVFFVSGVSALVYQIVWLKHLGFVFGNSIYAAATLIAVYLAGLGFGGYLFAGAFRRRNPLLVYAVLEGVIGLLGSMSPHFFRWLDGVYVWAYSSIGDSPATLSVARVAMAALFLLPPTMLMGGTLPVLVRWFTGDRLEGGRAVSSLYAVNTFGATAGVAFAGFYAIPTIGLLLTLTVAVALNFMLAVVSLVLAWIGKARDEADAHATPGDEEASSHAGATSSLVSPRLILIVSFLMGLTAIADEVFWSRILVLHLGSSVYSYSLMLFSFLIGLAAGSAAVSVVIERVDLAKLLARLEIALAAVLAIQIHLFVAFPDILEWLGGIVGVDTHQQRFFVFLGSVLIAILPPTALMGATFPVAVKLYSRLRHESESHGVGTVYFWNTVGSITGSLGAGFVFIRLMGSQNGLFAMAALNLAIALALIARASGATRERVAFAGGLLALLVAFFAAKPDQVILSAGIFADDAAPILLFREDVSATVTLRKLRDDFLSLELNGVNVAGTASDLRGTQKLQGHLPLLMHRAPKKVLHIGFGSGGTAYAVSLHPVDEIRIAEISPEVLEVSNKYLRSENHGVLDDARVVTEINDGRNFVLATPEKFDVILSDSIHPRYAGNGSLYTLDYFRLCREKLNAGGVVSMWLPTYSMTNRNYVQIVRAFLEVFPNTTIWYVPNVPNAFTIVIGRMEQGPIPLDRIEANISPAIRADLESVSIANVYEMASTLMLDSKGVEALVRGVQPHIDDLPSVEYESGRLLDREGSWIRNFAMLQHFQTPVPRAFSGAAEPGLLEEAGKVRDRRVADHLRILVKTFMPGAPAGAR